MPRFIALLRGVNVGKAKCVPMAGFRTLLCELGYTDVATLLNSGNAVFQATSGTPAKHVADIAAALLAQLQVAAPVIVKSAKDPAAIVAGNPLEVDAASQPRCLAAFVQDQAALPGLQAALAPLVVPPEQFAVGTHAAYFLMKSSTSLTSTSLCRSLPSILARRLVMHDLTAASHSAYEVRALPVFRSLASRPSPPPATSVICNSMSQGFAVAALLK
ncbi:MAG: DUF1697 domain-containing protein [Burkholderiales bacterium]|jgi:uncharacterized protein (DUF1697 family)|nr:DUF1697 domain-containing protein [Burkholderiales bacterium]